MSHLGLPFIAADRKMSFPWSAIVLYSCHLPSSATIFYRCLSSGKSLAGELLLVYKMWTGESVLTNVQRKNIYFIRSSFRTLSAACYVVSCCVISIYSLQLICDIHLRYLNVFSPTSSTVLRLDFPLSHAHIQQSYDVLAYYQQLKAPIMEDPRMTF